MCQFKRECMLVPIINKVCDKTNRGCDETNRGCDETNRGCDETKILTNENIFGSY